jgi:hypothetical protein
VEKKIIAHAERIARRLDAIEEKKKKTSTRQASFKMKFKQRTVVIVNNPTT